MTRNKIINLNLLEILEILVNQLKKVIPSSHLMVQKYPIDAGNAVGNTKLVNVETLLLLVITNNHAHGVNLKLVNIGFPRIGS